MGEIKSTLEIIMEKTKGLAPTDDEKREFKQKKMAGKVKGLIQKFINGIINIDRLDIEMAAIKEDDQHMLNRLILNETIGRIRPGEDNEPILQIMKALDGVDINHIREILTKFDKKLNMEREARKEGLINTLQEKGISGSAVIPNLQADAGWLDFVCRLKEDTGKKLNEVIE